MAPDTACVVSAIRSVVGAEPIVPLHAPDIGELERRYVDEALVSTMVSSIGPFVDRLEQEIATLTGAASAVAVSNGTVALQVALQLADVRAGDEVIVPSLSFIATANAVSHIGAHPVFADSDPDTMGLSPAAVRRLLEEIARGPGDATNRTTGRRIAAIVPMHALGHPTRIIELLEVAAEWGVPVVEDAAESLGSRVGARYTGTFGLLGTLSFNGNKTVTTGGGGMILTDDIELGRRAKHLTTTAKLAHAWEFEHDEAGYNYRMPNLNAALGVAQIERLPGFLEEKRELARRYRGLFRGMDGVQFLDEPEGTTSNFWLCAVRVDGGQASRDEVLAATNAAGLRCRPFWNLLSEQRPYRSAQSGDLTVARDLHASVVCLPSSPVLVRR